MAGVAATAKTTHGTSDRRPRARRTDSSTIRATVPLRSAIAKRYVTPVRRTNRVHRESLVHRRRRLARRQGPDEKRHHEREHAEIDRAQRADGKNDDETEEAREVDGHVSQSHYRLGTE